MIIPIYYGKWKMLETTNQYINVYRVGGFNPSEKNIKVWKSVGIIIHNWMDK